MDVVRVLAFYLPQFHPIPENDAWWGRGFTEWRSAVEAVPLFEGHYQPRVPQDLGFYDLRLAEARDAQAQLAAEAGVSGFVYYYYWFSGRRILQKPIDEMLRSGRPDFPFCLCWANENWTRRWDGREDDVLLRQSYEPGYEERLFRDVRPFLEDGRCVRVNDRPVFLVYRSDLLPDAQRFSSEWRRLAEEAGMPHPFLVRCDGFGRMDPAGIGFDGAYQFPPHGATVDLRIQGPPDRPATLNTYDYAMAIRNFTEDHVSYRRFCGVMVDWDNTPRRGVNGHVFLGSTPEAFADWLTIAVDWTKRNVPAPEQLVFVNAWNEWGEGCYLEPDRRRGTSYLGQLAQVLGKDDGGASGCSVHEVTELVSRVEAVLDAVQEEIRVRDRSIAALVTELAKSARLPWEDGQMQRLLKEQWSARSWTMTRPLRNWILKRRRAAPEPLDARVASDLEAVIALLALHGSAWWELGAPFRVLRRYWQGRDEVAVKGRR